MADLPIHSGADIHLADALGLPGCPLCRERGRTEDAYVEAVLAESVNDVAFRRGLDQARGFCGPHARGLLVADRRRSGSLGAAILLRATLSIRLAELEAALGAGGRTRSKRLDAAARPPDCPICVHVARTEVGLLESLVQLTGEAPWAEAAGLAPICFEHLVALGRQRPTSSAWPAIEARQLDRWRSLLAELDGYAHASSHDRRHLMTDRQRASVDEAADLLAHPTTHAADRGRPRARD